MYPINNEPRYDAQGLISLVASKFEGSGIPHSDHKADGKLGFFVLTAPKENVEDYECEYLTSTAVSLNANGWFEFPNRTFGVALPGVSLSGRNCFIKVQLRQLDKNYPHTTLHAHDVLATTSVFHISKLAKNDNVTVDCVNAEQKIVLRLRPADYDEPEYKRQNMTLKVSVTNVPKTGLFAGLPESVLRVVEDSTNKVLYESEVAWNNKNPTFQPFVLSTCDFTKPEPKFDNTKIRLELWNWNGKKGKADELIGQSEAQQVYRFGTYPVSFLNAKGNKEIDTKFSVHQAGVIPQEQLLNVIADGAMKLTFEVWFDFKRFHSIGEQGMVKSCLTRIQDYILPFTQQSIAGGVFGGVHPNYKDTLPIAYLVPNVPTPILLSNNKLVEAYGETRGLMKADDASRKIGAVGSLAFAGTVGKECLAVNTAVGQKTALHVSFVFLTDAFDKEEHRLYMKTIDSIITDLGAENAGKMVWMMIPLTHDAAEYTKKLNSLQYQEKEALPLSRHCTIGVEFAPGDMKRALDEAMYNLGKMWMVKQGGL